MPTENKEKHLTLEERRIILHRVPCRQSSYPVSCAYFSKCKDKRGSECSERCPKFKPFVCKRRDCSPGACGSI